MSSIKVTNLLQASSSTNNMVLTSGGDVQVTNNLQFNSGYGSAATAYGCRAWVNFNGTTATPSTIRGSGNVSSVTKNATGNFTINLATALPDANYATFVNAFSETASLGAYGAGSIRGTSTKTTSTVGVGTVNYNDSAFADFQETDIAIFR